MKALSFNAYTLKWIAVIGMISNHVTIALAPVLPFFVLLILYWAGGLTYVIMAYFVVEGYKHTSSLKKYIGRIFIFGLIAQAFHHMVLSTTDVMGGILLNIMFTILLSLFVLIMYDKIKIRFLFWIFFTAACFLAMFMDLFFVGILVPLLYYTIKKEGLRRTLPGIISGLLFLIFGLLAAIDPLLYLITGNYAHEAHLAADMSGMTIELLAVMPLFALGCFLGAALIYNYTGDRGKPAKWLFYVVYPLHLAVIAIAAVLAGVTPFNLFGFISF